MVQAASLSRPASPRALPPEAAVTEGPEANLNPPAAVKPAAVAALVDEVPEVQGVTEVTEVVEVTAMDSGAAASASLPAAPRARVTQTVEETVPAVLPRHRARVAAAAAAGVTEAAAVQVSLARPAALPLAVDMDTATAVHPVRLALPATPTAMANRHVEHFENTLP